MLVDVDENEALFETEVEKWTTESETMSKLVNEFKKQDYLTQDYFNTKRRIIHYKFTGNLKQNKPKDKAFAYDDFLLSGEYKFFSLNNKTNIDIPFYILQGENDYQTMTHLAKEYYNDSNPKTGGFYTIHEKYHSILTGETDDETDDVMKIIEAIYSKVYDNSK